MPNKHERSAKKGKLSQIHSRVPDDFDFDYHGWVLPGMNRAARKLPWEVFDTMVGKLEPIFMFMRIIDAFLDTIYGANARSAE